MENRDKKIVERMDEAQEAEYLLERIFYYMNRLVEEKSFHATILLLTDLGRTLVNSDRASFWYWDKEKKQYWTIAALHSEQIILPEGEGAVGYCISHNEVLVMNDPYSDPRFHPDVDKKTGYLTKSILCMPITNTKGEVIGAYQAINKLGEKSESGFDEKDKKRLTLAAVFCGKTLESNLMYQQTLIDPLTKLKNRRGFMEYYTEYVKSHLAKGGNAGIIMCDIDFFKKVNDTYGHNAGDFVLKQVACVLQKKVASKGEVVRWGGEEFILILKDWGKDDCYDFAEEIRKTVEDTVMEYEMTQIHITMSFGVNEVLRENTLEENVQIVDEKLYQAKQTGRNRVIL